MNTRSVNSAAGVIHAALKQCQTAAGIALALESAGLLMSPEAARDMASVSTDAVGVAERAVGELKREHDESARLRNRVDEVERAYTFDVADLRRQLDKVHDELTGTNLSLYEEELETARLRLALKSAQRGRREARKQRLTPAEVAAWLAKKSREYPTELNRRESPADAISRLADKVSRGAIRPQRQPGAAS